MPEKKTPFIPPAPSSEYDEEMSEMSFRDLVSERLASEERPTVKPPAQIVGVILPDALPKTLPPPPDDGEDKHKTPTVTPPDGESVFRETFERASRVGALQNCRATLTQIIEKIQIAELNSKKALVKPAIFLFPFPYFDQLGKLIIKICPMDAENKAISPENILNEIRRLGYFPTLHRHGEKEAELNFSEKFNLTGALTVYLQDLLEITPRLDTDALEIDFLQAGAHIEKADFDSKLEQLPSLVSGRNRGSALRITSEHAALLKLNLGEHFLAQTPARQIAGKTKKAVRDVVVKK